MSQIDSTTASKTSLTSILEKYQLSTELLTSIESLVEPLTLKKGEKFCSAGKVCDKVGILMNGILLATYDHENTLKPIVSRFFYVPNNIVVTSFESFSNQSKANENITAWEPSQLLCINKKALDNLYMTFPEVNMLGRVLAEKSYCQALQRAHTLQVLTVKQRLDHFCDVHAVLLNKVQNQHIASYLGINRNEIPKYFQAKRP